MSRTIKRGTPPRRAPAPRRKVAGRQVSTMDRLIGTLPVSPETLHRMVTGAMLTLIGVAGIAGAAWAGVPGMIGAVVARQVGEAGFRVTGVQITGRKRMSDLDVYAVVFEEQPRGSPIVSFDLGRIRGRLLEQGWVAEARVSRRLPDTLLVDIVERTPAAVWQDNGQLTLIDAGGTLLERVSPDAIPDLPLIIGPGADRQEGAYQTLLAAAPALKPRVKAATWVGNRRWDLDFDTGERLALPEDAAAAALVRFAELDGARKMLGRGWLRFDMRDPTRLVARRPGQSLAHQVPDDGRQTAVPPTMPPARIAGGTEG